MQKLNYILVGLLCLPLLFINIKDTHDWGDDFAQYIHQAKNITEGKPQGETGYVYNEDNFLGPRAYPAGFPLMLAPVYGFAGNSIYVFSILISVSLYLLCFLLFYFYSRYFSSVVSFLLILIMVYNPWTLRFKGEIMSEIPFTLFLVLTTVLYLRKKETRLSLILLGLAGGYLITIRNIGFVFPLAVMADTLNQWYRARKYGPSSVIRPLIVNASVVLSVIFATYLLLAFVLFPGPGGGLSAYPHLADAANFKEIVLRNIVYNIAVFQAFFSHYNVGKWEFALYITKAMMLVFVIIGIFKKISTKVDFIDTLVFFYLLAIMVFPYGDAGFRFILPVLPFLMYYVVVGIKSLDIKPFIKPNTLALLLGCLVLVQYKTSVEELAGDKNIIAGPLEPSSVEAFGYIRNNTPQQAVIAFCKPRAMALYTGRSGIANSDKYTVEECQRKFTQAGVTYYLVQSEISDQVMKDFLKQNEARIKLVWNNDKFTLYK